MKELASELYKHCYDLLLGCDELDSDESLQSVFLGTEIASYRRYINKKNNHVDRIHEVIRALTNRSYKGKSVLALFLEALAERYPAGDDTGRELERLAYDVSRALAQVNTSFLDTVQSPSSLSQEAKSTSEEGKSKLGIDVGIVLALKEEFVELLGELIKTYTPDYDSELHAYYYHFQPVVTNKAQAYRCVATFVGDMGSTKAALAAEKLISKWKPYTLVLLGIAGALDSDVLLGDVVVADQIDMYLENAKAVPAIGGEGYRFQMSGEVYRSSHDLRVVAEHFEIAQRKIFLNWQEQCARELQQLLPQTDILKMELAKLLRQQPKVQVGHIASGPAVGASIAFKNWLKNERDRKYLALEMEAGGFMTALHERGYPQSLILRAISDYGDERKKELDETSKGVFRRYAVHNAVRLLWSFFEADIFRLTR